MIVAAVSGGLDSVAMLWKLLEGDEPVHAHFVNMRVRSGRGNAEAAAIKLIGPWLRDNRGQFEFTASEYRPNQERRGYDVVVVSRHVGQMCKTLGLTPSAYCRGGALHDESAPGIKGRRRQALIEWRRWWPDGAVPPTRFPLREMSRAEIWAMLPDELRRMTTSCRKPVVTEGRWTACGACRPCREMAADDVPLDRRLTA